MDWWINEAHLSKLYKPKTLNYIARFPLQVYPRSTTFTLTTCSLSITTFNITPTIPARKDLIGEWPKINFYLPKEIVLVNNEDQCKISLQGTKTISLQIRTACPAPGGTQGLKAIVPRISDLHIHKSRFWDVSISLPTIWVRRQY